MKSARRRSRELATQGLYQWLLSGSPGGEIDAQLRGAQGFDKADQEHLDAILHGVIKEADTISAELQPCLDRPLGVERTRSQAASGTPAPGAISPLHLLRLSVHTERSCGAPAVSHSRLSPCGQGGRTAW